MGPRDVVVAKVPQQPGHERLIEDRDGQTPGKGEKREADGKQDHPQGRGERVLRWGERLGIYFTASVSLVAPLGVESPYLFVGH